MVSSLAQIGIAAALGAGLMVGGQMVVSGEAAIGGLGNCTIKGNISINSGERIYHVPGQDYYAQTKISPDYGERWFCSEAEAGQAGWRKSRV